LLTILYLNRFNSWDISGIAKLLNNSDLFAPGNEVRYTRPCV